MNYLGTRGYTIFKSNLSNEQIRKIKKDLIVKPFSTHAQEISYPIFRESDRKFYLPRYYGIEDFGKPEIRLNKGLDIDLEFQGTLRDYQYNIIDKYIEHFSIQGRVLY